MTDTPPSLDDVLTVTPAQLTTMTPPQIDALNAVLGAELSRVADSADRAADGIHRALLQRQESRRRGRGYSQVWPTTLEEAERTAREHLATGYEPDQMTRIQAGLSREGAYGEQLRSAVGRLDSLRAELRGLLDGPLAVLDGEFSRRGGWSRMHLCTSDGGHIHAGRQCPSIGPSTPLALLPEVSGMGWREAYREVIAKGMGGATEAIMCTKCYPDAPTEWTEKQADTSECPGSRQYARLMDPRMVNRVSRWAECHVCHAPRVTVTPAGNLRKHDRPEGEETAPEQPQAAPPAPAADAPADGVVVIERQPLKAPEEAPAPQGKPGTAPTQLTVTKFLKAAGFQVSRYTESRSQAVPSGAKAASTREGAVSVYWREGDADFADRAGRLGIDDVTRVPEHPQAEEYARAYADALAPRYAVRVEGTYVYVAARPELPARPKGVPTAAAVRKALAEAGAHGAPVSVVDQPDHTRVSVGDEDHAPAVRAALAEQGWTVEESQTWQHRVMRITGSMPDRRARLRKLRQQRAQEPQERPAVAQAEEESTRQAEAAEGPAGAPQEAAEQPPAVHDAKGRAWRTGQRAVFRRPDGLLMAGAITAFGHQDGGPTATVLVDSRAVAPAGGARYGSGGSSRPRPVDPPQEWTRLLDTLTPA